MLLRFDYAYSSKEPRPIFKALVNDYPAFCLLDTGARIPVYTGVKLEVLFSGLKCINKYSISGFGGSGTLAKLYKVPIFTLRDGHYSSITFSPFYLFYCPDVKDADLILPAAMLQHMCCKFSADGEYIFIESNFNSYMTTFDEEYRSLITYNGSNKM